MTEALPMSRQGFRFFHRLRVRWVEVDMQKIVFNAHYLMYFDTAISDYWRTLAIPYEASMRLLGGDLYVKKATVEYHGSAQFDDQLDVALQCVRIGNSSLIFTGAIFRGETLLISCVLVYVFADPASHTSKPVPEAFRALVTGFETGQAMVRFKSGTWADMGPDAASVCAVSFAHEQAISAPLAWDEADYTALYLLAYNWLGLPVAAGRLIQTTNGASQVGRLAVIPVLQGAGLGHALLEALTAAAKLRGDTQMLLQAPLSAQSFYQRAGFKPQGEPFTEASISNIYMCCYL